MQFVTEAVSSSIVSRRLALDAIRLAYIAAAEGNAVSFPSLQGNGPDPLHRFAVKAAHLKRENLTGMKIGSYWPSSDKLNLSRGANAVLFLNGDTGRIQSMVQTSAANAYRTAAGNAAAASALARSGRNNLTVFGSGFQSFYEVTAVCDACEIDQVFIVNRSPERAGKLAQQLAEVGITSDITDGRSACAQSGIVITVTTAREPILEDDWIMPGTHMSCMGADTYGKQELPVSLLHRARLFCDLVPQSKEIGEFQRIAKDIDAGALSLVPVGDVIRGTAPGRQAPEDITIFDSSGIATQDIFLAKAILDECLRRGEILEMP